MNHWFLIFLFGSLLLGACTNDTPNVQDLEPYTGPIMEIDSSTTWRSDSARLVLKIVSGRHLEYANGDREFLDGVDIEFYEKDKMTSTLRADEGRYNKEDNAYLALGNVIVTNMEKGEKLNTEELHWTPSDGKIFTDKFVRIETKTEILLGEGLNSNQTFSEYSIPNPTGTFSIDNPNETAR